MRRRLWQALPVLAVRKVPPVRLAQTVLGQGLRVLLDRRASRAPMGLTALSLDPLDPPDLKASPEHRGRKVRLALTACLECRGS